MITALHGYLCEISEMCEMCCTTKVAAESDICEISFRTGRHRLRQAIDSGRRTGRIYRALDPLHADSRRRIVLAETQPQRQESSVSYAAKSKTSMNGLTKMI